MRRVVVDEPLDEPRVGMVRRQGPRGFMRGWTANYLRLGPQTVITFVALEQLRKLAGMDAL
mgnify:CR=1 FL=1